MEIFAIINILKFVAIIALIIGIGVVTIILARKRRQRRKEFMDDLFGKK